MKGRLEIAGESILRSPGHLQHIKPQNTSLQPSAFLSSFSWRPQHFGNKYFAFPLTNYIVMMLHYHCSAQNEILNLAKTPNLEVSNLHKLLIM